MRALVVGASRAYREGLAAYLSRCGAITVVGTVDPGEGFQFLADARAQVVLVDVSSARIIRDLPRYVAAVGALPVVALVADDRDEELLACVDAGVTGCIGADASADEICSALEGAVRGEPVWPSRAVALLRDRHDAARAAEVALPPGQLTRRESQVLPLLERGLTNKEIASELRIAESTVKKHVGSALGKLNVRRRNVGDLLRSLRVGARPAREPGRTD